MSKRGSHGGAWKVAYADFVTAMMALFLVLWIVAMSQEMKESIAGYFRSTALLSHKESGVGALAPITQMGRAIPRLAAPEALDGEDAGKVEWGVKIPVDPTLRETASTLQRFLRRNNQEITDSDAFRMEFTNDGFRIHAIDRTDRAIFDAGSSKLTDYGRWILDTVAWELERFPFQVEVEGHTQGGTHSEKQSLSNWDLSTRRAIAAQQYLEEKGVRPNQFWRVAGYADRQLLDPSDPNAESNRRITIVVRLNPNSDINAVKRAFQFPP